MDATTLRTQLIEELATSHLSIEDQDKVIAMIGENISKQVVIDMTDAVPEEKRAEFRRITETGDGEALAQFLEPIIPDFDEVVRDASRKVLAELKAA